MIIGMKAIGTVVTVLSSAQFGKDMYDKYKTKKKDVKLEEVHKFIGSLDLQSLQEAIESKDEDKLINAVEDIIKSADAVKHKSDLEELTDDVQDVAGFVYDKVTSFGSQVIDTVGDKINEFTESDEPETQPTFKEFRKKGKKLKVMIDGSKCNICIDDEDVHINKKAKSVTFIKNGKVAKVILA